MCKPITPNIGENLFCNLPPNNSLVSGFDFWRAFWADTVYFKGPRLASFVASGTKEIQGHHQVLSAMRGGPITPSRTADLNLDFALVENMLIFIGFESWGGGGEDQAQPGPYIHPPDLESHKPNHKVQQV